MNNSDQYQQIEDNNDSTNFQQISNTTEYESASHLFDQANHTNTGGVYKATATLDDGLVNYNGIQLPRSVAADMGIIPRQATNDIHYQLNNAVQTETAQEDTTSTSDVLAGVPDIVSAEQSTLLNQAIAFDGGSVDRAISDVLTKGDLTPNTLEDLARASGADVDTIHQTVSDIGAGLDRQIEALSGVEGASDLLRLAAESEPNMVKASLMAAVNGDVSNAMDIAKHTYANLDTTSYRSALIETLEQSGYQTITKHGGLFVMGKEFADPTAWSTASALFSLNFTD